MPNYILKSGSFVELSDDELMHWKYIKREKVNGKWVYTYEQTEKSKQRAAARQDRRDERKERRDEKATDWRESKGKAATLNQNGNKSKVGQYINAAKFYIQDRLGYDEKENVERTKHTKEVASAAVTSAQGKIRQSEKKYGEAVDKAENADGSYSDGVRAAIAVNSAKNELKRYEDEIQRNWDKLPEGEKRRLRSKSALYDDRHAELVTNVAVAEGKAELMIQASQERSRKANSERDTAHNELEDNRNRLRVARDVYLNAGKVYADARKDYLNTPLGRIETATDAVTYFLDGVFKGSKKKKSSRR